jgi:hypothetical protein
MKYYSDIKNEILSFVRKWMEMKDTMLYKISQIQKIKQGMFSLIGLKNNLKVEEVLLGIGKGAKSRERGEWGRVEEGWMNALYMIYAL